MSINNATIKRIAKDVKYIMANGASLSSENIYYKHDEENIMKGYALIIGQHDTPYGYGYYFFEFKFPYNYPFSPPEVRYLTNDGSMRFNPNLYTNGKVCLSVLNTWAGESWTACQTIYSILFTLSTVLCANPLLNEPGIREDHNDVHKYNYLVCYKNVEFAICKLVNLVCFDEDKSFNKGDVMIMKLFKAIICETFTNNKEKIIEYINANRVKYHDLINVSYNVNSNSDPSNSEPSSVSEANTRRHARRSNLHISVYNLKYDLDYDILKKLIYELNIA
jgi:ubiquitin-conjugating enzyme E2 Z